MILLHYDSLLEFSSIILRGYLYLITQFICFINVNAISRSLKKFIRVSYSTGTFEDAIDCSQLRRDFTSKNENIGFIFSNVFIWVYIMFRLSSY